MTGVLIDCAGWVSYNVVKSIQSGADTVGSRVFGIDFQELAVWQKVLVVSSLLFSALVMLPATYHRKWSVVAVAFSNAYITLQYVSVAKVNQVNARTLAHEKTLGDITESQGAHLTQMASNASLIATNASLAEGILNDLRALLKEAQTMPQTEIPAFLTNVARLQTSLEAVNKFLADQGANDGKIEQILKLLSESKTDEGAKVAVLQDLNNQLRELSKLQEEIGRLKELKEQFAFSFDTQQRAISDAVTRLDQAKAELAATLKTHQQLSDSMLALVAQAAAIQSDLAKETGVSRDNNTQLATLLKQLATALKEARPAPADGASTAAIPDDPASVDDVSKLAEAAAAAPSGATVAVRN